MESYVCLRPCALRVVRPRRTAPYARFFSAVPRLYARNVAHSDYEKRVAQLEKHAVREDLYPRRKISEERGGESMPIAQAQELAKKQEHNSTDSSTRVEIHGAT